MPKSDAGGLAARRLQTVGDRAATAAYIAKMTKELRELARRDGYPTLAYLLDVARLEAALKVSEALDAAPSRSNPAVDLPETDASA